MVVICHFDRNISGYLNTILLIAHLQNEPRSTMVYTIVAHLYTKDDPTAIEKVKNKLIEAAQVFRKVQETIQWEVMQDVDDPRAFTVVERYERESVSFLECLLGTLTLIYGMGVGVIVTEIPSGESVLEDVRRICGSAVGKAD